MPHRNWVRATLVFASAVWFAATADASITFGISYTPAANESLNASQRQMFQDGLDFWDAIIDGHQDNVSRSWTISVNIFNEAPAPGTGLIRLGSAGPSALTSSNVVPGTPTNNQRFIISTAGQSEFNMNAAAGLTLDTIKHEFGHALGIGTLWEDNQVYSDGVALNSNRTLPNGVPGQYVGLNALNAYRAEFVGQSAATFVPVELSGGPGTAHGHWDESDDFGRSLTGVVDQLGRDRRDELMTGFASPGLAFLSNTSIQSLVDIGFTLHAVAIPEPGSFVALTLLLSGIAARRRVRA